LTALPSPWGVTPNILDGTTDPFAQVETASKFSSYGFVKFNSKVGRLGPDHGTGDMTTIRKFIVVMGMTLMAFLAYAQSAAPAAPAAPTVPAAPAEAAPRRVSPAEAKNHVGETVIVCGNVVDTRVNKYGLSGRGKPVIFDLDQPEPNPVFYFVTFGAQGEGPQEAITAYKGKSVCVTGKVALQASVPFVMVTDRSKIKTQTEGAK
jgi:hypothetical protein